LQRSTRVGDVDRSERRARRWRAFFSAIYLAVMVWFLATPDLRIVGLFLVAPAGTGGGGSSTAAGTAATAPSKATACA